MPPGTTSHYGWLYNFLFFNDGFHVEHHSRPALHWRNLPEEKAPAARRSSWPAVLRWVELGRLRKTSPMSRALELLERLVLKSKWLQSFVLRSHEKAFRQLLARIPAPQKILIIGGGLYPRTTLILQQLLPNAKLLVIDCNRENINTALPFLRAPVDVEVRLFNPSSALPEVDLLVVPLAFHGNRRLFYAEPAARNVIIHDWIWRRTQRSCVVSCWLLKRLNLVSS